MVGADSMASWKLIFMANQCLREYVVCNQKDWHLAKFSYAQERVLMTIFTNPDGIMLKDIAFNLGLTPGAVSQTIDGLVKMGIVQRIASHDDRRVIILKPTEEGLRFKQSNMEVFNQVMEDIEKELGPQDIASFIRVLNKVVEKTVSRRKSVRLTRSTRLVSEESK